MPTQDTIAEVTEKLTASAPSSAAPAETPAPPSRPDIFKAPPPPSGDRALISALSVDAPANHPKGTRYPPTQPLRRFLNPSWASENSFLPNSVRKLFQCRPSCPPTKAASPSRPSAKITQKGFVAKLCSPNRRKQKPTNLVENARNQ